MNSESNYSELKTAALAATQGPWKAFISGDTCAVHTPSDKRCENIINWPGFDCRQNAEKNAAFIAAANPAAVLILLAERDADKKRICELERSETQLIDERDSAHAALDDMYEAATGERPEWSNWFGFADAVEEVAQVRARLTTPVRLPEPCVTTEQLNNMADGNWPDSGFFEMIKEMARELLASRVAKPVGFISAKHGPVLYGEHIGLPAGTHFYTIPSATLQRQHECMSRLALPWVEGAVVPVWVRSLAAGVQGCESVYIVAELDTDKQSQGWPQFITAYIDIRLGRCICGSTAEDVSDHVRRYLPFDHSEVHAPHAE